jgi:hypothetical protein
MGDTVMFDHIRTYYTMLYCNMAAGPGRIAVMEKICEIWEEEV